MSLRRWVQITLMRRRLAPIEQSSVARRNLRSNASAWLVAAIVVGGIYLASEVLIPITLAIFLSFVLAPIAAGLRKLRFGRVPSVLLAVGLAVGFVGASGAILVSQASTLIDDAPVYAEHLSEKTARVHAAVIKRFGFLARESVATSESRTRTRQLTHSSKIAPPPAAPMPVEIRTPPLTPIQQMEAIAQPMAAPLGNVAIVLVVTIFMLLHKEDLRDRAIRVFGAGDLHRSTMALSDAGRRLSRYFLSQLAVNASFGCIVWLGTMVIGVPSPGLWGVLAGLLRFAPYIGTMIAAGLPMVVAAAVSPGWTMALEVVALFAVIEPLIGYGVEPLLYGRSTGLSPLAVIVSALFWTWLWGPVGLVLSMPLTLMLVVVGRHIPQLAFFEILLGDRPALSLPETFYQRMLAGHHDEALDQAAQLLETISLADYFDTVVLGALRLAITDLDRGAVDREDMKEVCQTTVEVIEQLPMADDGPTKAVDQPLNRTKVACIPARGALNIAVDASLRTLLERIGYEVVRIDRNDLMQNRLTDIDVHGASIICVVGLFDDRATGWIWPLRDQLANRWPHAEIIVGVTRGVALKSASEARSLPTSLAELVDRVADADQHDKRPENGVASCDQDALAETPFDGAISEPPAVS